MFTAFRCFTGDCVTDQGSASGVGFLGRLTDLSQRQMHWESALSTHERYKNSSKSLENIMQGICLVGKALCFAECRRSAPKGSMKEWLRQDCLELPSTRRMNAPMHPTLATASLRHEWNCSRFCCDNSWIVAEVPVPLQNH